MKYIGMPMGMWVLFRKSFERNLITEFGLDRNTAKAVAVKAKRRYKEIIAGLPEFEKEDRFKMNIVNCTLLAAFVLNMPDRPDVKRLTTYYAGSMMIPAMKWFCRQGGKSKFSDKDISSMKATERLKAADRNPYSWNMEFYPYPNDSGYEVRFTACGICTLMRELGMYDFVPAMCRLDYTMSEAGGASDFVREYTLASGGPYCDCGYKKKQDRNDNKGFWDRWARRYDRTISIEKNTYARILSRMKKKLDRDMYVLEPACGTGVLSVQLAGNVKMLEATDFSEKMIEQAKIRPQSSRLHFSVQDATALPYAPETFDAVIISNALHIMPAPEKALTEIRRVLKPDGILIAPTFTAAGNVFGRLKIRMMELSGFQVFHKWKPQEYLNFLKANGFTVTGREVYGGALALTYAEAKVKGKRLSERM